MKSLSKVVCCLAVLSVFIELSSSNDVTIKCDFYFPQSTIYTCGLGSLAFDDDSNTTFVIDVSSHIEGFTNADVTKIEIFGGNMPFIVTELFATFPNIRFVTISSSGLTRIQSHAFNGAAHLESLVVYRNPLRSIEALAFSGAAELFDIDVSLNELEHISEIGFVGLEKLRFLNLGGNQLRTLPTEVFQPLTNLAYLQLAMNELTALDGKLFSGNRLLVDVSFQNNSINSIGERFLDGLDNLLSLNILQNQCVDSHWIIDGSTSIETVREGLQTCFENFAPPVRKFVLELRGSLTLFDENGTEVLHL